MSEQTEHTPGPWKVGLNLHPMSENYGRIAIGSTTSELAIAVIPLDDDEAGPNAHLIAAAPELLSLAEDVGEYLNRLCGMGILADNAEEEEKVRTRSGSTMPDTGELLDRTLAAIAKAKGGE